MSSDIYITLFTTLYTLVYDMFTYESHLQQVYVFYGCIMVYKYHMECLLLPSYYYGVPAKCDYFISKIAVLFLLK